MELSIIIPVYNSAKILPILVDEIEKALKIKIDKIEIIFVNDFSIDSSWEKIKELAKEKKFIKGINLKENYGQHNAIAAGLSISKGKFVVLMDDDLQHDPIYIDKILNELKNGYDSCYVKYIKRKHSFIKVFISWINHITSSYLSEKPNNIYTSSFKGFKNKITKKINDDKNFEVFLDWLILENSQSIQSIEIVHRERLEGKTNYNFRKLLFLWSNMILRIKPRAKIKKIIIFFLKFFIISIIYKLLSKKNYKEKFLIKETTFS